MLREIDEGDRRRAHERVARLRQQRRERLDRGVLRRTPERTRGFVGIGLLVHGVVIGLSILPTRGCLHERPLGVPAGSGTTIAQGQIATNLQQYRQQEQQRQELKVIDELARLRFVMPDAWRDDT